MRTLNVPTSDMTEIKRSAKTVFKKAEDEKTGVYVFNRNKPAGVVLSVTEYENMVHRLDQLQEELINKEAEKRLNESHQLYSDFEVRGEVANQIPEIDENDGWE